jgi:hypothetical protein
VVWAAAGVTVTQQSFEVQEKADFAWIYEVGPAGLGAGDIIRLHDPVFHGMRWSKWGELTPWWDQCTAQASDQEASLGLLSAHPRRGRDRLDDVALQIVRSNCDESRQVCRTSIHEAATTEVEVLSGTMQEGDEVVIGIGDTGACVAACTDTTACSVCSDCGFEMPDRAFEAIHWPAELCLSGDSCTELAVPPLEVRPLAHIDTVLATVPSQAVAGEAFRVKVALLDAYGNAALDADHLITVHAPDGTLDTTLTAEDGGWTDFEVTISNPGVYRIMVDTGPLRVETNPVHITEAASETRVLWGDIHVHHGHTFFDFDGRVRDANHDYGRDIAGLDVVSETQKALGVEIGEVALWSALQEGCRSYTEPGRYIVLLGFEWMGQFAGEASGRPSFGHHNVYYDTCEAPIGTHDATIIDSLGSDNGLWQWLSVVKEETGTRALTVPHAMRRTGRDFRQEKPGVQTLAEIYSEWGNATDWGEGQTDEDAPGSVQDMLNSGMRLGWIGGSDNHDGWMGNPYSSRYVRSGLAAFITTEHSREAVFDAMLQRRTYATTGHRPILRFSVADGGQTAMQGSEIIAQRPAFEWRYEGTANIDEVTLWRVEVVDGRIQSRAQIWTGDGVDGAGEYTPPWDGLSAVAYWLEVRQWDGEIAWSSPIWLTGDCSRLSLGAQDPLGLCPGAGSDTGAAPSVDASGDLPKTRCSCASEGRASDWWAWMFAGCICLRRRSASSRRSRAQR